MDTRTQDELRSLRRQVAELQSEIARLPVRQGKVSTGIKGRIIRVQVNGAVSSGDSTGNWDNPIAIVGPPPDATGTFDNSIYQQEYADNDVVFLLWNSDAEQWEPERGGSAGSILVTFRLTEDKAYADVEALAKPVDSSGAVISGADDFHVVDHEGQFYGKIGYLGVALRYIDDYGDGKPGYRIITMEGPIYLFVGVLDMDYSEGGTDVIPSTDEIWGRPFRGERLPDSGPIEVFDDLLVAEHAKEGEKWLIAFDEADEHYIFVVPLSPRYITIKGVSPGVTRGTTTFTLGSPESVNGPVPTGGAITVTNDPPLDSPSGRTIYARYNVSRHESDDLQRWDTGDFGNILEGLRGLADWNTSDNQVIDHDGDTDPHWHGTGPCEPEA